MNLIIPKRILSRRNFLQLSGLSGVSLLMGGCGTNLLSNNVGQIFQPLNQTFEELLLSQKPVPEFSISEIEPEKLLVNSFNFTPKIDPALFRLKINGEVDKPMQLKMEDIQKLPLTTMVIRHVCVEGWAAIVQWGGVQLKDLVALVQPKSKVRYVYFKSADGYYESWDIASVIHPQTLMAYQKNGEPLSVENGAPLRLASPIKLGYKLSKWVDQITFTSSLFSNKGYWEDQGYDWFAGL
ncbi:molybdopterin-dependent oxidoreductase [Cronbergia sp. UHCC 0137]|uniref:molybdopterin-dependent oxidoreductase n=1 Tax=Cronbergia sp. UHCC 0137 TaxID=3110239 RepID=UPI002B215B89|nr:molybdopterin-dependent oxidoreductase [Cronbergia sp. UHCC 0137]MEA5618004.1 molybdopterin-dependent oxidoreductase [Cronbergia sp. UHCC 0137]